MKTYKRVFCIVIDSVGCGECPESYLYGDKGANTLKHLSYSKPDFSIPTLQKLNTFLYFENRYLFFNISMNIGNNATAKYALLFVKNRNSVLRLPLKRCKRLWNK